MARITVEDCITKVSNRFDLVMLAAQRARDISAGAPLTIDRDNDKNPVVALREIADSTVDMDHLRYELIHGLRRHVEVEAESGDTLIDELGDQRLAGLQPGGGLVDVTEHDPLCVVSEDDAQPEADDA